MKSNRLCEIDIIRSLVTLVLVAFHSFAPFTGSWVMPIQHDVDSSSYFWLAKFLYSGMLETFVFISGYVFALGDLKYHYDIHVLLRSKIQRLYVPCLFFGFIFLLLFRGLDTALKQDSIMAIISGVAHLWFLPMLLWCFFLEKIWLKFFGLHKWWILLLVAVLPYPTLPLRLNSSLYYLFFFHAGYLIFNYRDIVKQYLARKIIYIPFLIICYLVMFYMLSLVQMTFSLTDLMAAYEKAVNAFVCVVSRLLYSSLAVILYYIIGILLAGYVSLKFMNIFNKIAISSFGIYIFQEMILRLLYYKTSFCSITGLFFPWIGFGIAFLLSLLITNIFIKIPFFKKIL